MELLKEIGEKNAFYSTLIDQMIIRIIIIIILVIYFTTRVPVGEVLLLLIYFTFVDIKLKILKGVVGQRGGEGPPKTSYSRQARVSSPRFKTYTIITYMLLFVLMFIHVLSLK